MRCYIDVDENGYITDILAGNNLVIDKEYDYVFNLDDDVDILDLQMRYKVVDGKLTIKSEDELPEENNEPFVPEEPLTLEKLQQEQEMLALAIMDLAEIILNGGDE